MLKLFFLLLLSPLVVLAEGAPVKIGFISPLSGSRSSLGEDARKGAELAVEDLGEKLSSKFSITYEDSQADPKTGVSAFRKLASQGVKVIITQNSNISIPILELSQSENLLQLAISTTSDKYSTNGDLALRVNGPTIYEAITMAEFIAAHPGKISVLTMQDEYPVILSNNLMSELNSRKIKPFVSEDFSPNDNDFRTLVAKTKNSSLIACLGYQSQCGMFVKQLKEAQSKAVVLVNTPVNSKEFFEIAGAAAEGTFVVYPTPDYQHPAAQRFKNKYGFEVNFFSAGAYDAISIVGNALPFCTKETGITACLAGRILKNKEYSGLSGKKTINAANGDMSDNYSVLIAKSGKFVPKSQ